MLGCDRGGPSRGERLAWLLAAALVASTFAVPLGTAQDGGEEVVFVDEQQGAASWGMQVDNAQQGDFEVDLLGELPYQGSRLTVGGVIFDDNREWGIMFAATLLSMPDRTVLQPEPGSGLLEPVAVNGDAGDVPDVDLGLATDEGAQVGTASHNEPCRAAFCFYGDFDDAEAGSHHFIFWMAGVSGVQLEVEGEAVSDVTVERGDAVTVGDREIRNGEVNIQQQKTYCEARETPPPNCPTPGVTGASYDAMYGVKAIKGAHADVTAEEQFWGYWSVTDFKWLCQYTVGTCPHLTYYNTEYQCSELVRPLVGERCDRYHISWEGPHNATSGYGGYTFLGTQGPTQPSPLFAEAPPGDYSFNIDAAADLYGPRVWEPNSESFVFLGEYFTTLTLADAELPPPT